MGRAVVLIALVLPAIAGAEGEAPEPVWVKAVTATSVYADKHDAYAPWLTVAPRITYVEKTNEVRFDSAWCEGKPDEGIGEGVTITFVRPTPIDKVTIKAGVWRTQKLFDTNNVITGLELVTSDGRTIAASPPPRRDNVVVSLGGAPIDTLKVKITGVKKGKANDSCLTEIALGEPSEGSDGAPVLVGFDRAAAESYADARDAILRGLSAHCDAAMMAKYADFPFPVVWVENTHGTAGFVRHPMSFKSAADFHKRCPEAGLPGPTDRFAGISSSQPGRLTVAYETADSHQHLRLAWLGNRWHLVGVD